MMVCCLLKQWPVVVSSVYQSSMMSGLEWHKMPNQEFSHAKKPHVKYTNSWPLGKDIHCKWLNNINACLTILFPPLMKIVTARVFLQSSITNILSLVVPKVTSRTMPAVPSFSAVRSANLKHQPRNNIRHSYILRHVETSRAYQTTVLTLLI